MSDQPNKYLAAATAHYRALGTPSIKIPEWKIDGVPVEVFWTPLNGIERDEIFDGSAKDIEVFLMKALDADNKKMFTLADKPALQRLVAPQIITRVAQQMMALPAQADVEKN
jgi:hypothetical protein